MDHATSSLVLTAADSAALSSPLTATSASAAAVEPADLMPVSLESECDSGIDISDIAKQLVFSPVKPDEPECENASNNAPAPAAAVEPEAKPTEAPVAQIEVAAAAVAEAIAVSSVIELACSTPLPADEDEVASAAPVAADDEDATGAAFPTFASAVDSDELSYVSTEMKAQEMLLLEVTQPAAAAAIKIKGIKAVSTAAKPSSSTSSTPRSRSHSRSNSSSAQSTPRSSSVQRTASSQSSASRLTAPTFSSSKRRAESVTRTPQSFARDVSSAMAGLALLTGAAGERKKPAVVAGEAKKLTIASSPKLKTSAKHAALQIADVRSSGKAGRAINGSFGSVLLCACACVWFSRVRSHSTTALSSEESELLRIRVERSALAKLAQHNARHLDAVLHGSESFESMLPVRSTKPLTQPQDIKLHTSGRPKVRAAPVEEPVAEKKATALAPGQLTQAKPFSFMTDARSRSSSVAPSPIASRAASRAASRSTSRAGSRSVSRSASRSGSRVGSRVGSRAGSPSRSTAAAASAAPTPTQAREFSFATSLRAAFKTAGLGDAAAAAETPASARKSRAASGSSAASLTQPKPFVLSTDSRLGSAGAATATPFVSLAAQAASFLGRGNDRVVAAPAATAAQALTTPREFKFHTTARERSVSGSGAAAGAKGEEKQPEQKPASAAAAHRSIDSFRAPQLTQVQPFHLSLPTERAPREDREALDRAELEKERAERKARLLAAAKPAGSTTTVAQAPALAVLQRVPLKEPVVPAAEAAKPAASSDDASTPRLTAPHPFHLSTDARGERKTDAFHSRLEEDVAKAKAAAEFHARPMPIVESAAVFVPKVPSRRILADLPPALRSVALHAQSQSQFAAQIAAEQSHAAAQRSFVAKPLPATILGSVSFVPKPSDKALTTPADIELSSSSRAAKRAAYEHEQAVRAEAAEKRRAEAEAIRAAEEAQKIKAFRQSLVHQAKPAPSTSAVGTRAPR